MGGGRDKIMADSDGIQFLTFEDVCAAHAKGLTDFGEGEFGFVSEHSVRSAAAQPQAGAYGQRFYSFPAGMAAAYLYYLTHQQGFVNGNKRAAVGSALKFLARNGYGLDVSDYDLYLATIELAGEDVQGDRAVIFATLENWVADHLAPLD